MKKKDSMLEKIGLWVKGKREWYAKQSGWNQTLVMIGAIFIVGMITLGVAMIPIGSSGPLFNQSLNKNLNVKIILPNLNIDIFKSKTYVTPVTEPDVLLEAVCPYLKASNLTNMTIGSRTFWYLNNTLGCISIEIIS